MCNKVTITELSKENPVYVPMAADIIHPGHLNIINKAAELGKVVVGLFTDEAIATYKKAPTMNYEMRKKVVLGLKGVEEVIPQISRDYEPNLRLLKPKYMVHGTDWKSGPLSKVRQKAIDVMKEWGGEVIEPEYTKDISSTLIKKSARVSPETKRKDFTSQLYYKNNMVGVSVYDKITAKLADAATFCTADHPVKEFSSLWVDYQEVNEHYRISSEIGLGAEAYVHVLDRLNECTVKPLIADDIKGSSMYEYQYLLRSFQKIGLAGMVVYEEDVSILESRMEYYLRNLLYDNFKLFLHINACSDEIFYVIEKYRHVPAGIVIDAEKEVTVDGKVSDLPILYFVNQKSRINDYKYRIYRKCIYDKLTDSIKDYLSELLNL